MRKVSLMNQRVLLSSKELKNIICLLLSVLILNFLSDRTQAWDAAVGIDRIDDYFYVDSFSGSFTWTTLSEGVDASSGTGSSLPNSPTSQDWDGSSWPSDIMSEDGSEAGVFAESYLEHYDGVTDEFFDYAEAYVFGDIPFDKSFGASWFYDFELVLDPGSTANVFLDSDGAYGYIESEAGDDGNAFVSISLYSFDIDLDDPGGVNDPYDEDFLFLSAPPVGGIADSPLGLSHTFSNAGGTPVTYNLRLEGSAIVFENIIPEPGTLVLAILGVLGTAPFRRSKVR